MLKKMLIGISIILFLMPIIVAISSIDFGRSFIFVSVSGLVLGNVLVQRRLPQHRQGYSYWFARAASVAALTSLIYLTIRLYSVG